MSTRLRLRRQPAWRLARGHLNEGAKPHRAHVQPLAWAGVHVAAAQTSSSNDLRDIRIGMSAADLPDTGYIGFACASDASRKLSGWSGWHDCPSDADGLHAIHFGFDPETS